MLTLILFFAFAFAHTRPPRGIVHLDIVRFASSYHTINATPTSTLLSSFPPTHPTIFFKDKLFPVRQILPFTHQLKTLFQEPTFPFPFLFNSWKAFSDSKNGGLCQ